MNFNNKTDSNSIISLRKNKISKKILSEAFFIAEKDSELEAELQRSSNKIEFLIKTLKKGRNEPFCITNLKSLTEDFSQPQCLELSSFIALSLKSGFLDRKVSYLSLLIDLSYFSKLTETLWISLSDTLFSVSGEKESLDVYVYWLLSNIIIDQQDYSARLFSTLDFPALVKFCLDKPFGTKNRIHLHLLNIYIFFKKPSLLSLFNLETNKKLVNHCFDAIQNCSSFGDTAADIVSHMGKSNQIDFLCELGLLGLIKDNFTSTLPDYNLKVMLSLIKTVCERDSFYVESLVNSFPQTVQNIKRILTNMTSRPESYDFLKITKLALEILGNTSTNLREALVFFDREMIGILIRVGNMFDEKFDSAILEIFSNLACLRDVNIASFFMEDYFVQYIFKFLGCTAEEEQLKAVEILNFFFQCLATNIDVLEEFVNLFENEGTSERLRTISSNCRDDNLQQIADELVDTYFSGSVEDYRQFDAFMGDDV